MNLSWLPWRRRSDDVARAEVDRSRQRLIESEELKQEAQRTNERFHTHLRRNRFGTLINKQVFGGRG